MDQISKQFLQSGPSYC